MLLLKRKMVSAITLTLLLAGMLTLAFNIQSVRASGTIYIRADGSIDPSDAPISTDDNMTYAFFENITSTMDGIVVQRNNILIDAKGYFLQESSFPPYFGTGFNLTGTVNVTIKNAVIRDFVCAIHLLFSSNNSISGNSMTGNYSMGIELQDSHGNFLSSNNVTQLQGGGIYLDNSSNNVVERNTIIATGDFAISLTNSSGNILRNNKVTESTGGIKLQDCSGCLLSGNNATGNASGIMLVHSSDNIVTGNSITKDRQGVGFDTSDNNTLSGNNITDIDDYGITMYASFGNSIFHNNLVNNGQHAESYQSLNGFDRGYPAGGNYWSSYSGIDVFSGRYQNETGSDGIGDTPYTIDQSNIDHYPLMNPWVRLPGDINGDRIVDIYDAILLASAYNSTPRKANWNPNADINGDNIVDIYDAIILASHFNQHSL